MLLGNIFGKNKIAKMKSNYMNKKIYHDNPGTIINIILDHQNGLFTEFSATFFMIRNRDKSKRKVE